MAKLMTNIPADKMKSFVQTVSPSRFGTRNMVSQKAKRGLQIKPSVPHLKRIASSFILFDWEFFSNELEYE